jgi:exodeoxyribonuclease VII small subunit
MSEQDMTYRAAVDEIESILKKIEEQDIDVDELSSELKRVSELLRICRKKLHTADKEIEKIIREMED